MASIANRASELIMDALMWLISFAGAVLVVGTLVLVLASCTSTSSIQSVSEICTMGDVQAYQHKTTEEKVSFVCK